jgi:WD40 repeat protein
LAIDLKAGVVRILQSDGKTTSGAGFVVSEKGLLATCSHVIQPEASQNRGEPRPEKVYVIFCTTGDRMAARVLPEFWRPADQEDVAVLQLEGNLPAAVRPLSLGSSQNTINHSFQTFGFPELGPKDGTYGDGHILNELQMHGTRVLQVSSPQVTPGFSGGPVLDLVTSRIVGMVTAIVAQDKYGRMAETAYITPSETLREICPQIGLSDIQPYLGLAAFTEKDAEFFFGRRRAVEKLVESLRSRPRFLGVMGPSGSGKSSIIQAGLIPVLRQGSIPGSDRWDFIIVRPADNPFEQLEIKGLAGASKNLAVASSSWIKHVGRERFLLILDQFEEFLATCPPHLRQDFWDQLSNLLQAEEIPVIVMIVMRDDFFSSLAQQAPSALFEWIEHGFVHISSNLEADEIKEIVQEPARKVGLHFEEGLADVIVNDVLASSSENGGRAGRSTVLPLLEFALTQLWERQKEGFLTHNAYNAIGKVTGGLTLWADKAYRALKIEGYGLLARRILTDLVNLSDEQQRPDSKRRRSLDELSRVEGERESVHKIVQRLADARLVTTSSEKGSVNVEIIHDSLIKEWKKLRNWLKEDRSFLAWDRDAEKDAQEWIGTFPEIESRRDEGKLLRGLDLNEAEKWLKEREKDLSQPERDYIHASIRLRDEEHQRRRRNMQVLAAISIVALVFAGFAGYQWDRSENQKQEAFALYQASQSEIIKGTSEGLIRSVTLAIESLRNRETAQGVQALRYALELLPRPFAQLTHKEQVFRIAFSPDGKKLATRGRRDNTSRIWDAETGRELIRLDHDGPVWTIAFTPDGQRLVTISNNNTSMLWEVDTGEPLAKTKFENTSCIRASWTLSADKKKVAIFEYDKNKTVDIYGIETGRLLIRVAQDVPVMAYGFGGKDGKKFVIISQDNTSRIWDTETGRLLTTVKQDSWVLSADFSPDGQKLATASENVAKIWDAQTGQQLAKMEHNGWVESVAFSPDGKKLATGSLDNTARIWDVQTGQQLIRMEHERPVSFLDFSRDGKRLVTVDWDNVSRVWDTETGSQTAWIKDEGPVRDVALSPNGKKLATASGNNSSRIWNLEVGECLPRMEHEDWVNDITFSPDGKKIATASDDRTAKIWDAETGKELASFIHDGPVVSVAFSPDGNSLATASGDQIVRILDVETGKQLTSIKHGNAKLSFSPDGKKLATGSYDGTAKIWDVETGIGLAVFQNKGWVWQTAFSPDGKKLAIAASTESVARIWDVETGRQLCVMKHDSWVQSVAFSPDGKKLATSAQDKTARVWDVETGKQLVRMDHDGIVLHITFSPDGRTLATASTDRTARVWDVDTGRQLTEIEFSSPVQSVAFSPDGKRLATASRDHMAKVWLIETDDLICEACNRLKFNLTSKDWWQKYCGSCSG